MKRFHFRVLAKAGVAVALLQLCSTFPNMHIKFSRFSAELSVTLLVVVVAFVTITAVVVIVAAAASPKIPFGTELCAHIEFVASLRPKLYMSINRYFVCDAGRCKHINIVCKLQHFVCVSFFFSVLCN